MAECMGDVPVGTKTDRSMAEFLDRRAERLGVTRAELLRRLLDEYRAAWAGERHCPYCKRELRLYLRNAQQEAP